MVLKLDGWVFDLDLEATSAYSGRILADHCQCGYCRNFYQAVDSQYPMLRVFLKQFGADVEAPDELMPYEPIILDATYVTSGVIVQTSEAPICIHDLIIEPMPADKLDFDTECPAPCFALSVSRFRIPWLLEENMDDVVSPANEPEYLQRMWTKLLQEQGKQELFS